MEYGEEGYTGTIYENVPRCDEIYEESEFVQEKKCIQEEVCDTFKETKPVPAPRGKTKTPPAVLNTSIIPEEAESLSSTENFKMETGSESENDDLRRCLVSSDKTELKPTTLPKPKVRRAILDDAPRLKQSDTENKKPLTLPKPKVKPRTVADDVLKSTENLSSTENSLKLPEPIQVVESDTDSDDSDDDPTRDYLPMTKYSQGQTLSSESSNKKAETLSKNEEVADKENDETLLMDVEEDEGTDEEVFEEGILEPLYANAEQTVGYISVVIGRNTVSTYVSERG